jgi:ferric-dicitrate binding protein FerR (iron transport regulator)
VSAREPVPAELRALRHAPPPPEPAAASAARRAALWPAFEAAFERARPEPGHTRARWAYLLVAAAVAVFAVERVASPPAERKLVAGVAPVFVTAPAREPPWVHAAGQQLELANGVRLEAEVGARFAFDPAGREVALELGLVTFSVPPLVAPARFEVRTPTALVVVHGTTFSVEVRAEGTRVAVTAGVVSVSHDGGEVLLHAGESWPIDEQPVASTRGDRGIVPPVAAMRGGARSPSSTLQAENALFAQAMAARRSGDDREAIRLLDELVREYPQSPLRPEAERQRARLRRPPLFE